MSIDLPDNSNICNNDIERAVVKVSEAIPSATSSFFSEHKNSNNLPDSLVLFFKERKKLKRKLRHAYFKYGNTAHPIYSEVKSLLKNTDSLIRQSTSIHQKQQLAERLKAIKPGPDAFRKLSNLVGGRKPSASPESVAVSERTITSKQEIADSFAAHFAANFQHHSDASNSVAHVHDQTVADSISFFKAKNNKPITSFSVDNPSSDPVDTVTFIAEHTVFTTIAGLIIMV